MMDATRRTRGMADAASADQHLPFVLRQAAVRCLERFKNRRLKPFDYLLGIFALYFADVHDMPFVKIIWDSPFRVDYKDPQLFLKQLLEQDTRDVVDGCIAELREIAEAVDHDNEEERRRLDTEAERRRHQQQQVSATTSTSTAATNRNNRAGGPGNNDDNSDDADDEDDELDDDDDGSGSDDLAKSRRAADEEADGMRLSSFFQVCLDVVIHGSAVADMSGKLHPDIADEAAELVSFCGSQLPRAIATLEALAFSGTGGSDGGRGGGTGKNNNSSGGVIKKAEQRSEQQLGVDSDFYNVVSKIAKLILARQRAAEYVDRFKSSEMPPPVPGSKASADAKDGEEDGDEKKAAEDANAMQTVQQAEAIMQRVGEHLAMDEHAFTDEVQIGATSELSSETMQQQQQPDWAVETLQEKNILPSSESSSSAAAEARASPQAPPAVAPQPPQRQPRYNQPQRHGQHQPQQRLIKPERFAKVITGYSWSRYNKAHYTFERPPPKTVQAYEFTLFYPLLPDPSRRVPRFELLPTDKGWDDEYCYIEFRAGPPYANVAYRIVNKKWDKRRVNSTFDPSGRYKLYFKFEQAVYRR